MASPILRRYEKRRILSSVHGGKGRIVLGRLFDGQMDSPINIYELTMEPDAEVGEHMHMGSEEALYVISGKALITVDRKEYVLEPGDAALTRSGGTHGWRNIGDSELHLIVVSGATNILQKMLNSLVSPILDKLQDRHALPLGEGAHHK